MWTLQPRGWGVSRLSGVSLLQVEGGTVMLMVQADKTLVSVDCQGPG
jgi:hypothetical protein